MLLPRWTVYPALVVIAGTAFIALPTRRNRDPYSDATGSKSVVVLGIDDICMPQGAADAWRVPVALHAEPSEGVWYSGMMTPTLDLACAEAQLRYKKAEPLEKKGGTDATGIEGPTAPYLERSPTARFAFTMYVDRSAEATVIVPGALGDSKIVLRPGEWSDFVKIRFDLLPRDMMQGTMQLNGICRFYLRSLTPNIELYASPVSFDP